VVLIWDENGHHVPPDIHPLGIRGTVSYGLVTSGIECHTVHLDEPEAGLPDSVLDEARVLVWWGHARHDEVPRKRVLAVAERVRRGALGLVLLHSAHQSQVAAELLGARAYSKGGWDDDLQEELVRVCAPLHPICAGVKDFVIEDEEFYGAPATFPPPEVVLLQSRFPRYDRYYPSGMVWTVGQGKQEIKRSGPGNGQGEGEGSGRIVYLRPGHETSRSLSHPSVRQLVANAVRWCQPQALSSA
jgi:trehalose utilization protein